MEVSTKTIKRFWSKVDIREPDQCWEWQAYKTSSGHGQTYLNGKVMYAHRVAFIINNGFIPQVCRHTCDNGSCCNPDHLENGSQTDNVRDMNERGRNYFANKTHCPQGHPYSGDNLVITNQGRRRCYICRLESKRKYNRKNKKA